MKPSRLALSLACAALVAAPSTSLTAQDAGFGVRSGVALGGFAGIDGLASRPGFTVGPTFAMRVNRWLAVQGELLYSAYGARWNDDEFAPTVAPAYGLATFRNLQIPVLARLDLGRLIGSSVDVSLYAGPHASYMLSCRLGGTVPCGALDASPFARMDRMDVGTTAGLGLVAELFNFVRVAADVRYQQGLSNIVLLDRDFRSRGWTIAFNLSETGSATYGPADVGRALSPDATVPRFPTGWQGLPRGVRM